MIIYFTLQLHLKSFAEGPNGEITADCGIVVNYSKGSQPLQCKRARTLLEELFRSPVFQLLNSHQDIRRYTKSSRDLHMQKVAFSG